MIQILLFQVQKSLAIILYQTSEKKIILTRVGNVRIMWVVKISLETVDSGLPGRLGAPWETQT